MRPVIGSKSWIESANGPADDVEGVVAVGVAGQSAAVAYDDGRVLVVGLDEQWGVGRPEIPLAERRVLEQLAAVGQVAIGEGHVARGLDHEEAQRLVALRDPPVGR